MAQAVANSQIGVDKSKWKTWTKDDVWNWICSVKKWPLKDGKNADMNVYNTLYMTNADLNRKAKYESFIEGGVNGVKLEEYINTPNKIGGALKGLQWSEKKEVVVAFAKLVKQ